MKTSVQQQIATLTLNPTIDAAAEAESVVPYRKIRTSNERYSAGGGGINVAQVIHALGGTATAVYLAGGATGTLLTQLLDAGDIPARCIPIAGVTRIAHTILERATGAEYRFVPEGPEISDEEWSHCLSTITRQTWDYLVVSGSLCAGVPPDAYATLATLAHERGGKLILDSSGQGLRSGLQAGVFLVKPSLGELEAYTGRELKSQADLLSAAKILVAEGKAKIVAVTMSSDGALLVAEGVHMFLKPPPVVANSAVGAGDSFVGAITLALARGESMEQAFAFAVATGTAAVLAAGHEAIDKADVEQLVLALAPQRSGSGSEATGNLAEPANQEGA